MAKLNLSALKANSETQTQNPEIKAEEITPLEVKVEEQNQPQVTSKKKFSLKELNISGSSSIKKAEETKTEEITLLEIKAEENQESPKKTKIGLNSLIKKEPKIEEIKAEEIVKEEVKIENTKIEEQKVEEIKDEEIEEEVKVLSISDGDTSCSIVTEKKSEIFGNYKGSFTQTIEEPEAEEVTPLEVIAEKTKTEEITPLEVIAEKTKTEEITPLEIKAEETKTEDKKTNLQSFKENTITNKKNKSKKILLTSLFTISSLSLSGFFIIESGLLKSNIQETKKEAIVSEVDNVVTEEQSNNDSNETTETTNIPENITTEEPITTTENTNTEVANTSLNETTTNEETNIPTTETTNIPENITTEENIDNNIKVEENEIVKENGINSVDNNANSNKINEKLQNFLIKKYKK